MASTRPPHLDGKPHKCVINSQRLEKEQQKKKHGKRERKCFPKSSQELNEGFTAMCLDEVSLSYQGLKVLIVEFV